MSQTGCTPTRILIAAMGGDGGGVLAGWITEAAVAAGCHVQRTSVPGVAQRTGSTTYYIEVAEGSSPRPVMALNPAPGLLDVVIATELLEAARTVQSGFVAPDRTVMVGSSHRVFTIDEKSAMADGRLDDEHLLSVIRRFSRKALLDDMAELAVATKSHLNAVMLGAFAGTRALPIPPDHFRNSIGAEGKAVEANLRGFEAGLALAEKWMAAGETVSAVPFGESKTVKGVVPPDALSIVEEGVRRLTDYQGPDFAQLYRRRIERFASLPGAEGEAIGELARHLAIRMSVEDVIRVAQLKLRESRLRQVRAEARAKPGDIVHITEFLKPGPEEILSLLPVPLARWLLTMVEKRGWMHLAFPMKVRTTALTGFLQLKFLSSLRFLRPHSLNHAKERAWIEHWLDLCERSVSIDSSAALEVIKTARLVKGYGDTYRRGWDNWARIAGEVVEPMLQGRLPRQHFADAVMQARIAAESDPEGHRLDAVIAGLVSVQAPAVRINAA